MIILFQLLSSVSLLLYSLTLLYSTLLWYYCSGLFRKTDPTGWHQGHGSTLQAKAMVKLWRGTILEAVVLHARGKYTRFHECVRGHQCSSYFTLPLPSDSQLSTPEERTPHGIQASDLGIHLQCPFLPTPHDRLPLSSDKPTLPGKTVPSVGKQGPSTLWGPQD